MRNLWSTSLPYISIFLAITMEPDVLVLVVQALPKMIEVLRILLTRAK